MVCCILISLISSLFKPLGCFIKVLWDTLTLFIQVTKIKRGTWLRLFNLGNLYEQGKGVPQDFNKAAEWFKKAADQGYEDAANHLADLKQKGLVQ